jgi:hypothetical protein
VTIQEVFAPKVSQPASQGPGLPGGSPYVTLTTFWPNNPNFTATQYAQGGGNVFFNYATTLNGSPFSSATVTIASSNFIAASSQFYLPSFKIPTSPLAGMLNMKLVSISTNAFIDPLAFMGIVFYP